MQKPLISFVVLTYNQEKFVEDAIEGAFSQTYEPLEIVISDDCSSDHTFTKIQKMVKDYKGPHKIILNQNKQNLGIRKHYQLANQLANGEYIIGAAGDDKSLPDRAQRSFEIFQQFPNVTCVNFESVLCDKDLNPISNVIVDNSDKFVSMISIRDYILMKDFIVWSGDSRALRKNVLTDLGPIAYGTDEDSTLFVRSLLLGNVCHSNERMVLKRFHGQNVSNVKHIKKFNVDGFLSQPLHDIDYCLSKGLISSYLASLMRYKMNQSAQYLTNKVYESNNIAYKILYYYPIILLTKLKNKIFK